MNEKFCINVTLLHQQSMFLQLNLGSESQGNGWIQVLFHREPQASLMPHCRPLPGPLHSTLMSTFNLSQLVVVQSARVDSMLWTETAWWVWGYPVHPQMFSLRNQTPTFKFRTRPTWKSAWRLHGWGNEMTSLNGATGPEPRGIRDHGPLQPWLPTA